MNKISRYLFPRYNNYCNLLPALLDLARKTSARILEIYQNPVTVQRKEDATPLTEADLAAHQTLISGLGILTPQLPVLSEESKNIPFEERYSWRRYWLIDPLDGTREFINRTGQFTVNIALIDDHEPILGVVFIPTTGVCYYACRGEGAFRQLSPKAIPEQIHSRPFGGNCIVVAGGRSHGTKELQRLLDNLPTCEIVSFGSAIKSCLVAEGKVDLYPRLGPTCEWDTAAAQCIVEEAGGVVTNIRMERLLYNTKRSLLNPYFFVSGDPQCDWSRFLM